MTKGIILLAYGKADYIYMAAHLMASLKFHSPDIPITLLHDDAIKYLPKRYHQYVDQFIEVKNEHLLTYGAIDPGKAKCNLIHYLPYDKNLYLDVDGLAMNDVSNLFESDKPFQVEVTGSGSYSDDVDYNFWANPIDEWEHFNLDEGATFRSVQSSSMLFQKGEFCDALQEGLTKYFDFPKNKLKNNWGSGIPDELIYSGVLAGMDYDPSFDDKVVFFGFVNSPLSFQEIKDKYKVLAMYGNGKGTTLVKLKYIDWYNRMNVKLHRKLGIEVIRPIQILMRGKHVG